MSAPSTSGLSVIKSYCYELSTLNKVYFTLLYFMLPGYIYLYVALKNKKTPKLMQEERKNFLSTASRFLSRRTWEIEYREVIISLI